MTVNNQIVVGTLMNLSDNPTRVSIGQKWRDSDVTGPWTNFTGMLLCNNYYHNLVPKCNFCDK